MNDKSRLLAGHFTQVASNNVLPQKPSLLRKLQHADGKIEAASKYTEPFSGACFHQYPRVVGNLYQKEDFHIKL